MVIALSALTFSSSSYAAAPKGICLKLNKQLKFNNQTYYLKLINNKYELKIWHADWYGDINKNVNDYNTNYSVFTDAKNRMNLFIPYEYKTIENIVIKTTNR